MATSQFDAEHGTVFVYRTAAVKQHILTKATDWPLWKLDLMAALDKEDCLEVCQPFPDDPPAHITDDSDSDTTAPPTMTPKNKNALAAAQRRARHIIMGTISPSIKTIFLGDTFERDPLRLIAKLWGYLFADFDARLFDLEDDFEDIQKTADEDIRTYASRIRVAGNLLATMGGTCGNKRKIARFRRGLRHLPEWHPWDAGHRSLATFDAGRQPTFEDVVKSACDYESTLIYDAKRDNGIKVSMVYTGASQVKHHAPPRKFTCDRCGKNGHIAAKCRAPFPRRDPQTTDRRTHFKKTNGARNPKDTPPGPCRHCGGDHWNRECPTGIDGRLYTNTSAPSRTSVFDRLLMAVPDATTSSPGFIVDSGATTHVVNRHDALETYTPANGHIIGFSGERVPVKAIGTLPGYPGIAKYVPSADVNVLSISQLTANGWRVHFDEHGTATLTSPTGQTTRASRSNDPNLLYRTGSCLAVTSEQQGATDMLRQHQIWGHPSKERLHAIAAIYDINTKDWPAELPHCPVCHLAKAQRAPIHSDYVPVRRPDLAPGQRLHADLIGPVFSTRQYILDVVDEATRFEMAHSLTSKSQTPAAMAALIDAKYGPRQTSPEEIHSDQGGEFTGAGWKALCHERLIRPSYTAPNTPAHNGIAERNHGATITKTRALLLDAGFDANDPFLGLHAYEHAMYLHNISPHRALPAGTTPYELWHGAKAPTANLHRFGTLVYYFTSNNAKFGKRASTGIYLGPAHKVVGNAIKVLVPGTQTVITSRDYKAAPALSPDPPARPAPTAVEGEHHAIAQGEHDPDTPALVAIDADPSGYKDAVSRPDAAQWTAAIEEEAANLLRRGAFEIVDRDTTDRQPVRGRWVFKIKRDDQQQPVRHKARLVACGYAQLKGIDYHVAHAPVAAKESVRALFALAAQQHLHVRQFDFDQAYVNADLDTDIFMYVPDGLAPAIAPYVDSAVNNLLQSGRAVLRLRKALYGLKQSGRLWYDTLCEHLHSLGFSTLDCDPCVFKGPDGAIIVIYVDDGLLFTRTKEQSDDLLRQTQQNFSIKDLGTPRHFVGWDIDMRGTDGIFLGQKPYSQHVGDTFAPGQPPRPTPYASTGKMGDTGSTPGDQQLFMEAVGSLNYAAVSTRPDLAYAVSSLSRNMQQPTRSHIKQARNAAAYLNATAEHGLLYKPADQLDIDVYCDASFAPEEDMRKSRTGYLILVNGAPVAWRATIQPIVAHSTAEAECIAAADAARDAMFIARLYTEIGIDVPTPTLHEDNETALHIFTEIATKRSKHLEIRYHYVRHLVQQGRIKTVHCRTASMLADALTKPLPRDAFISHRDRFMAKGECRI